MKQKFLPPQAIVDIIEDRPVQICNRCGKPVNFGSGGFVNRVPDFNSYEDRQDAGGCCKYPIGDFICFECDEKCPCGEIGYDYEYEYGHN
jgi:hypothetical protein